jgi:hypothetical protein
VGDDDEATHSTQRGKIHSRQGILSFPAIVTQLLRLLLLLVSVARRPLPPVSSIYSFPTSGASLHVISVIQITIIISNDDERCED